MSFKLYIFLLLLMLNGISLSKVISNETSTKEVTETSIDINGGNLPSIAPPSLLSSDTKYEEENLLTKDNSSLINSISNSSRSGSGSSSGISSKSSSINKSFSFNATVNNDFAQNRVLHKVKKNETVLPSEPEESSSLHTTTTTDSSIFITNDSDVIKISSRSAITRDETILNTPSSNDVQFYEEDTTILSRADGIDKSDYLLENNKTINNITIVRKCCEVDQFFSLVSGICESIENNDLFDKSVFSLLEGSNKNISYQTGTLKVCPETNEPPSIINDITNSSYSLLDSGVLVDKVSQYSFNQTHYCLELVGAKVEEAALTLAYCLTFDYEFEFYDYVSDNEEEPQETVDSYVHIVRKCCGEFEYYSTTVHKCITANTAPLFPYEVQRLSFETNDIELKIISSRIHECPDKSVKPKIIPVDTNAYRLLHTGDLIEVQNGVHHNYSYYCLELVGEDEDQLSFTLALCSQTIEIPKCCPYGKYFDEIHLDCLPQPPSNENHTDVMSKFETDLETYLNVPIGHFLRCQNTFPVQDEAENLFIKGGKLCNNMACFEKEDFCIDYIGKDSKELKASAFYCQKEYFVKCCKEGFILSINGCTEYSDGKSVLLEHLTNTRTFVNSFDTKVCRKNKGILLDQTLASYVIWWVSNDGSYLTVSAEPNKKIVHNYCVDDFIDSDGHVGPGAYVCESDVNHLLPNEHHFLRYSKKGSLGKCCPENVKEGYVFYYSSESNNCEIVSHNESLKDNFFLNKASFTEEHFHDFPECPSKGTGYHSFPFQPGEFDYADISSEGVLKIISKDGKCILREDTVEDRDYCIEYVLTSKGELKPSAFLCAYAPETKVYEEKYIFITVCISISCFCLLCTLIYLFTVQVKRGFVTVRKVNTLAGRILVSFVSSNLIGFAAFSLTQHDNSLNKQDTIGCYILAGFVQFFNLATFCWNTSICLESLLLTIDISISKCIRYLLHSLWAWGFPFATTLIMFLMDAYREELPCGIITPKIGVSYCFHSDSDSKLVYFYVPILFTLIANLAFIFGAKAMRRSRLKKLEMGQRAPPSGTGNRSDRPAEGTQAAHSGMRTHQNLNTKTESARIVLWTGTTWFSELAGFVLTRYVIQQPNEHWYNYLWYIPTSFNALRGAGIFGIIVLLPEKRKIKSFFMRTKIRLRKLYKAFKDSAGIEDSDSHFRSSTQKSSFADVRRRNMSVTTMISTLSSSIYNPTQFFSKSDGNSLRKASIGSYLSSKWESLRKTSSNNINNANNNNERSVRIKLSQSSSGQNGHSKPLRKLGMVRSVSQIDRRASNSSGNSFIEELEMEEDYGKRKCSIPLPKLQEEESYMEREETIMKSTEKINEPVLSTSTNNLIKKSHSDTYIYDHYNKKENLKGSGKELDEVCTGSGKSNTLTINSPNFNKSLSENNLPNITSKLRAKQLSKTSVKSNNSVESEEELSLKDESKNLCTDSTYNNSESDLEIVNPGSDSKERNSEVTENEVDAQVDKINEKCHESQTNVTSEDKTNDLEKKELDQSPDVKSNKEHTNSDTKKTSIELEDCDTPIRPSDGNYEKYKESTA